MLLLGSRGQTIALSICEDRAVSYHNNLGQLTNRTDPDGVATLYGYDDRAGVSSEPERRQANPCFPPTIFVFSNPCFWEKTRPDRPFTRAFLRSKHPVFNPHFVPTA